MRRTAVLYKRVGETPLQAIGAWKAKHPEYASVVACYAGRLDPMADGKLLVLFGDECKRQKHYTGLDKEYEIEVLLDLGSDTGDVLGIPDLANQETRVDPLALHGILQKEKGKHLRKYPLFSSKTVNGKPLFLHTLEENTENIDIPEHIEEIYAIKLLEAYRLPLLPLRTRIFDLLSLAPRSDEPSKALGADFRQDEIREKWGILFSKLTDREFAVLRLRIACGSGTYMRSLASRIGEALGSKGLALSIRRTRIGRYAFGLWYTTYI